MTSASRHARKEENSHLLREDVAQRRTELRALPEIVALHTTERCNLRCTMCVRSLRPGKVQLPRARLGAVCDRLFPTAKKAALSAAAGEPLIADFDLVLEKALAHEVRIDVVTNGTELTAEAYREAAPALDHVNVSLDTAVPELYEEIRVGARFAKVEANLRAIAEERRRRPDDVLLSLSAVVMRSTLPHLADLVRFAGTVEADGVIFQKLYHSGKANPDEDPSEVPGPDAVLSAFEDAGRAAHETGTNLALSEFGVDNVLVRPVREKVAPELVDGGACSYVLQHFGVQPTGEVYPCFHPTDHLLGSVLEEDPVAIWNGRAARRLRAAHFTGRGTLFCTGCPHAPHLHPRWPASLVGGLRRIRMRIAHTRNRRRRERRARIGTTG